MTDTGDRRIGSEARRIIGRLDTGGHLERARAVTAWQEIAGPEVAGHATGYAMRGSELVVYTDTAVWAAELSALSERYRTALNEALGQELVGSIRFTVSKPGRDRAIARVSSGREDADRDLVEPAALDPAEEERLAELAGAIHDERLRDAALRAARRHLAWRKGTKGRKSPQRATGRLSDGKTEPEH